jgi:hypothetical protein
MEDVVLQTEFLLSKQVAAIPNLDRIVGARQVGRLLVLLRE